MCALIALGAPAKAQLAASLAIESDYRFRGYSLSEGRPTASVQLSYDDPSGLYLNGALLGVNRRDGVDYLGYQANVGFVRRVGSTASVEAGIVRSEYRTRKYESYFRSSRYTEAYVGANLRDFSARIFYAPHYFRDGVSTLYGELEAAYRPAENWQLNAHVGALAYLDEPSYSESPTRYDWRLSASRQFGDFEVHAAFSGGGPGKEYYYGEKHDRRTALTFGASLGF